MKSWTDFFRRIVGRSRATQEGGEAKRPREAKAAPDSSPPQSVNIGFDFGTSTTKVIARLENGGRGSGPFFILPPLDVDDTVLFPSTISLEANGSLLFGSSAESSGSADKVRSFKTDLPAEARRREVQELQASTEADLRQKNWRAAFRLGSSGLSAEDASTLYVAWVLSQAKRRVQELTGTHSVELTVNAAAPLDQLKASRKLQSMFHDVVYYGLLLSDHATMPWPLADAKRQLAEARRLPVPAATESPVSVVPETHAAMSAYMLRPGHQQGLYASVDVGAGTTDVALFWFHATDGVPEACYYGARSGFVGLDDVDHAMGQSRQLDAAAVRRQRERGQLKINRTEAAVVESMDRIYQTYRKAFGAAYERCRGDSQWVDRRSGLAKYTLCLIGGGAVVPELANRLGQPLPILEMKDVMVEHPTIPEGVQVVVGKSKRVGITTFNARERSLLMLAYGLAHRAVDIPLCEEDANFEKPEVKVHIPDRDEQYAK